MKNSNKLNMFGNFVTLISIALTLLSFHVPSQGVQHDICYTIENVTINNYSNIEVKE